MIVMPTSLKNTITLIQCHKYGSIDIEFKQSCCQRISQFKQKQYSLRLLLTPGAEFRTQYQS